MQNHIECQTTAEKIWCTLAGLFGCATGCIDVSKITVADINRFGMETAQCISVYGGAIIVILQLIGWARKYWKNRKRKPINDI